jgi:hypothetical protein
MSEAEVTHEKTQPGAAGQVLDEKNVGADDVGAEVLAHMGEGAIENIDLNGPQARKVLRKIDLRLLPFLCVTYLIQVGTCLATHQSRCLCRPMLTPMLSFWTSRACPMRRSGTWRRTPISRGPTTRGSRPSSTSATWPASSPPTCCSRSSTSPGPAASTSSSGAPCCCA